MMSSPHYPQTIKTFIIDRITEFINATRKLTENKTYEINTTQLEKFNSNKSALSDYKSIYQLSSGNLSDPELKPFFKVNFRAYNKEDYDEIRTIYSELHDINFYNKKGDTIIKVETKYHDRGDIVNIEVKDGKSIFQIKLLHTIRCEDGCSHYGSLLLGITELINDRPIRVLKASNFLKRFEIQL